MVDEPTPPVDEGALPRAEPEGPPPASGKPKGPGLLSSSRNRVIAAVAAVVVLFGVLAAVGFVVFTVLSGRQAAPPSGGGTQAGIGGAGVVATGTAPTPAATEPAEQVSLEIPPSFEVFTENKDPFKPLEVPTQEEAGDEGTTTAGETTGETTGTASQDTTDTIKPGKDVLYLHAIEGDVAIVYWDNERYEVEEGDQIDDSPWKVVSIGTSSATFLYGDDRITLRVGEQLGK